MNCDKALADVLVALVGRNNDSMERGDYPYSVDGFNDDLYDIREYVLGRIDIQTLIVRLDVEEFME